jgi:hypothetical protein
MSFKPDYVVDWNKADNNNNSPPAHGWRARARAQPFRGRSSSAAAPSRQASTGPGRWEVQTLLAASPPHAARSQAGAAAPRSLTVPVCLRYLLRGIAPAPSPSSKGQVLHRNTGSEVSLLHAQRERESASRRSPDTATRKRPLLAQ